jgi:hypothetical protein
MKSDFIELVRVGMDNNNFTSKEIYLEQSEVCNYIFLFLPHGTRPFNWRDSEISNS